MGLPTQLKSAIYKTPLPGSNKSVSFRPWNFGEEKNILVAAESGDAITKFSTVAKLIESCTFGKVKVNNLPQFYFDWIFIKIREKSEGEIINTLVNCPENKSSKNQRIQIRLPDIKLDIDKKIDKKIKVGELESGEEIFIELKWPTVGFSIKILEESKKIENMKEELKNSINLLEQQIDDDEDENDNLKEELRILKSKKFEKYYELQNARMMKLLISKMYDSNGHVYDLSDVSDKEFMVYMNNSLTSSFQEFEKYLDNVPKLKHEIKYKCRTCKEEHKINIEGLESFL